MQAEERARIAQHLRTTHGHLNVVIDMVEAGEPWMSILLQLCAVRAALSSIRIKLLICQLRQSQEIIRWSSVAADREATISQLLILYRLLLNHSRERG